jgi:dGTPase
VARVADIVAYVNHDIDDSVRAGILNESDLPKDAVKLLGSTHSERIGRLVTDVVHQSIDGGMSEIRMSEPVLNALVDLRSYLFDAVYENQVATAEFGKAAGILGGLWEKVQQRPEEFLDLRTVEAEGVDVAAQDFVAGMTDRYAVRLFEQLFVPKPWMEI